MSIKGCSLISCIWLIDLIHRAFGVFANGTNGMPMPSEVLPLVTTGTDGMSMATNGFYHWQPILKTTYSVDKITNALNDVIFKMTTHEKEEQTVTEW